MTNIQKAKEQGNQSAPNVIDAAKASEVQIDVTLAQEQGNQAAPLIADSLASSELYDAIKQQGNQAMPLIVDALVQPTPSTKNPMYLEAAQANSTVSMVSNLEPAPSLEYSIDGVTWQEWEYTDQTLEGTTVHMFDIITLGAVGDKVYFRGDNPNGLGRFSPEAESVFMLTGKLKAGDNVMSLLDPTMEMTDVPDLGFSAFFVGLTPEGSSDTLLSVPDMSSVTSIGMRGCDSMFAGQASLTAAADMPSLTILGADACFYMYEECTSLSMSNDGETLNFAFPAPPVTAGEETFETAEDIASWMGNTNGFRGAEQ